MLDESVLSTLHRGGEGQNVYRMFFPNPYDQGCSSFTGMMLSLGGADPFGQQQEYLLTAPRSF